MVRLPSDRNSEWGGKECIENTSYLSSFRERIGARKKYLLQQGEKDIRLREEADVIRLQVNLDEVVAA